MILQAALKIAREKGLTALTHGAVAKRCAIQTSQHTVKHYFAKQSDLQIACAQEDNALMTQAIELGVVDAD